MKIRPLDTSYKCFKIKLRNLAKLHITLLKRVTYGSVPYPTSAVQYEYVCWALIAKATTGEGKGSEGKGDTTATVENEGEGEGEGGREGECYGYVSIRT